MNLHIVRIAHRLERNVHLPAEPFAYLGDSADAFTINSHVRIFKRAGNLLVDIIVITLFVFAECIPHVELHLVVIRMRSFFRTPVVARLDLLGFVNIEFGRIHQLGQFFLLVPAFGPVRDRHSGCSVYSSQRIFNFGQRHIAQLPLTEIVGKIAVRIGRFEQHRKARRSG